MPTYEYETIPSTAKLKPVRFELYQPITAAALTKHPETGEPVRRIISGGLGIFTESRTTPAASACCHGAGGCGMDPAAAGCQGGMCGLE